MKVSVICITYNHEAYIGQCLSSLVNQKVTFDYEIIIHDDASTDNTRSIIEKFSKEYPDVIKTIYETENQHLKKSCIDICFEISEGEYIAICEGDDFWTDSLKLQMQVENLERNRDVDLCFHKGRLFSNSTQEYCGYIGDYGNSLQVISNNRLIPLGGGAMATSSIMIRREAYNKKIDFYHEYRGLKPVGDYVIQTIGSNKGAIYIPKDMSAYRINVPGSWIFNQSNAGWKKELDFKKAMLNMYDAPNCFLDYKYCKAFYKRKMVDGKDILLNCKIPTREKMRFLKTNRLLKGKLLFLLPIGVINPLNKVIRKAMHRKKA